MSTRWPGQKGDVPCETEDDIFRALGLTYVPPELRQDVGEFAASEKNNLPKLITIEDIRGVFHNHTTASDGAASLEEMAAAARHSVSSTWASPTIRNP